MTAAPFAVRLRPDGAGGVEAVGVASRGQLDRLRDSKDALALIVGTFGAVDVTLRPPTPIPEPEPLAPIWVRPRSPRRAWFRIENGERA